MKKTILMSFALFMAALANSCSSESANAESANSTLELTIKDEQGNVVKGAEVTLFSTKEDLENRTNPVLQYRYSDDEGKVVCENLDTTKYYWYIKSNCKTNESGVFTNETDLKANVVEKKTIIISDRIGNMEISNQADIPFLVNINGGDFFVVDAHQYKVVPGYGIGKYTITYKKLEEGSTAKVIYTEIKYCGFDSPPIWLFK